MKELYGINVPNTRKINSFDSLDKAIFFNNYSKYAEVLSKMELRGHILTCQTKSDYIHFMYGGFAGLNPIPVDPDKVDKINALAAKIGTNWDIIADLKRVKPHDYIFLHTEQIIYGPFEATTYFLESPNMPNCFKSGNLKLDYWKSHSNETITGTSDYPWRIGIRTVDGSKIGSVSSMELFKLTSIGVIQSIPQRFFYHDKPKIVKPMLNHEVKVLLPLLDKSPDAGTLIVHDMNLSNFNPITLDLTSYGRELFREKILEAWIMENITLNGNNSEQYRNVIDVFGKSEYFANSIFTYYTNFMDILLYDEPGGVSEEYCAKCKRPVFNNKQNIRVLELKKGRVKLDDLYQLREYGDWVLKALAYGNHNRVKLFVVGNEFTDKVLRQNEIVCIQYSIYGKQPSLQLCKVN